VDEIGTGDSFFALGGHSLLIVQVAARLREVFGVDVELSALFGRSTVAEIAELVDAAAVPGDERPRRAFDLAAGGDGMPLSFGQDRLWFTGQLAPGNPFYHTATTLRLRGELDAERLRRALTDVVARHAVLRTAFPDAGGQPTQRVSPPVEVGLRIIDTSGVDEARRLAELWGRRPMDLAAGPAWRFLLFRLAEDDHVFAAVLHHMVADGLSVRIFLDDLGRCYAGERLPELPLQYADFAAWQRERDDGGLEYWHERLAGAPRVLRLPADHERTSVPSFIGHRLRTDLSAALMEPIARVARANTATMFMTLLAAYATVLSRFGGGEDVVIGSPTAGRSHRDLEGLIGLFINIMALRVDCSGDPSFAELLGRVREVTLGAYDHQDVPFERVVERLSPVRDLRRNPVVQTLFQVLHAGDGAELALAGVQVSPFGIDLRTTRLDLELNLVEAGDGGWFAEFVYATDLFEPGTVRRLADAYVHLLQEVARDPDRPISELLPPVPGRENAAEPEDTRPDAPRADVERRVSSIWAEELGVERVGIYDDFFDHGGTPMAAVRAAARMTEALGRGVDVGMIFAHPTLAEFSAALAADRSQ
jgi:acyl carrier protein